MSEQAATSHAEPHLEDHAEHHEHVIVPKMTLQLTLAVLVFFTVLTVLLSMGEAWIANEFDIVIPQLVNVAIALSIASIKTTVVVMFFMQLKYDNPLNTMVFIFTVLTVLFFLGFTMLDLGFRGSINRFETDYIKNGGSGHQLSMPYVEDVMERTGIQIPADAPTAMARAARIADPDNVKGKPGYVKVKDLHHDDHDHGHGHEHSDAGKSRPGHGITITALKPEGDHDGSRDGDGHDDDGEH